MRKKNKYTQKQIEFLRAGYLSMNIRSLTSVFNSRFKKSKTEGQIKSTLQNHGIRCGRPCKDRLVTRYRIFNKEHEQFIRDNCTGIDNAEMAALFNKHYKTHITRQQIKTVKDNRRISSGLTGYFPKGHKSWNKGTKGLCKPNSGSFKKGHVPPNRKPVGSERYNKGYGINIKVAERDPYRGYPTRYKLKHVHVWEKKNGPVPKGKVVAFINGDNRICDPENLMLISRAELLTLNQHGYKDTPAELKPSILALSKLQAKTWAKEKTVSNGQRG
jgi:hypothetical protein